MSHDIVLIPGPMVGACSLAPTADRLRAAGMTVHLPDVLSAYSGLPAWRDWPESLERLLEFDKEVVLVGYSAATTLAAALAGRVPTCGLIFLDGEIPAENGPATPGSPRLRNLIEGLANAEGRLPPWSDWWRTEEYRSLIGIDALARDEARFRAFLREQPTITLDWFDDELELQPWEHLPSGYIQTSAFFGSSADDAESRGWPVVRIKGTHVHPATEPEETAAAICDIYTGLALSLA